MSKSSRLPRSSSVFLFCHTNGHPLPRHPNHEKSSKVWLSQAGKQPYMDFWYNNTWDSEAADWLIKTKKKRVICHYMYVYTLYIWYRCSTCVCIRWSLVKMWMHSIVAGAFCCSLSDGARMHDDYSMEYLLQLSLETFEVVNAGP